MNQEYTPEQVEGIADNIFTQEVVAANMLRAYAATLRQAARVDNSMWPAIDRMIVDAWKLGGCEETLDMLAMRERFEAALSAQPAQVAGVDAELYKSACDSAEEWKARALKAEELSDRLMAEINDMTGPTFMGEPVLPKSTAEPAAQPIPSRAYVTGDTAAIVGTPQSDHNCDAMGCASFGPHVLWRIPVTMESEPAAKPASPEQPAGLDRSRETPRRQKAVETLIELGWTYNVERGWEQPAERQGEAVGFITDEGKGGQYARFNEAGHRLPPGTALYTAAPVGVPDVWRETLLSVLGALDRATGDTDPNLDSDMADEDVRDEYPAIWAMQQLSALLAAAPSTPQGEGR